MDDLHKLFKNLRTAHEILELVENHFDDDTDAQEAFCTDIETIKSARAAVWDIWNNNSQFPDEFHEDLDNLSDDDLSRWHAIACELRLGVAPAGVLENIDRETKENSLMSFHSHATAEQWSDFIHKIDRCGLNHSYIHRLI
tara:strand:- start:49 stop:471 length:423 start_codon:yes stop_codon:yes gene_type:complete